MRDSVPAKPTLWELITSLVEPLEVGKQVTFDAPGIGSTPRRRKVRVYQYVYKLGKELGRRYSVQSCYDDVSVTVWRRS